jgi:hypothetical protein
MGGLSAVDENGEATSIHRKLDLVYAANNGEDLLKIFQTIAQDNGQEKYNRVRRYFPDGGCALAAKAILEIMNLHSVTEEQKQKVSV